MPRVKKKHAGPAYVTAGRVAKTINVGLSYRIVELFSEGLYTSANKAFEELVTNAFDAGATNVQVLLPPDSTAADATIVVADDGEGMNVDGLEELWQIGVSHKRDRSDPPLGRAQIGKFGIGKLATYVLANRLTHVCKSGRKYYATSMDYTQLDSAAEHGVFPEQRVPLEIRELSASEVKNTLESWLQHPAFKNWSVRLFGIGAPRAWTVAILSSLKDKANEIQPGRLEWILRTALPLRDDFSIHFNGKKLAPSKAGIGRIGRWVLGKEIRDLAKPAPKNLEIRVDENVPNKSDERFGLFHPTIGRITGYTEAYRDVLTGKSDRTGRSYGFFVYVRGRLINIEDEYFGIDSNLLRHGIFSRFRLVVRIDKLDEELRSTRESVRDGPVLTTTREVFHAIFNFVRPKIEEAITPESIKAQVARKIADSPASLSRRPIIELARLALDGRAYPRYLLVPQRLQKSEQAEFIDALTKRAETPDEFIKDVEFSYSLSTEYGIAAYDTERAILKINALHPFIGAFFDDYQRQILPLDLLAMAEVLLEAQLYHFGLKHSDIDGILSDRDELLRYLAKGTGRRNALMVSRDLQDARNSPDQLEFELVAAFDKLGFEAVLIGGSGKPDGKATAHLSADEGGNPRRYSVSLEAKSKKQDGKKVSAKEVGISTVTRQRNDFDCQHAVVVGPDFPTSREEKSALAKEIQDDRDKYKDKPRLAQKTITLIRIDDLAKVVRLAPLRQIGPSRLRDLFISCSTPEESRDWIDTNTAIRAEKQPYKEILYEIWAEQQEDQVVVEYTALRVKLRSRNPPIHKTNEELNELCQAMAAMAPGRIVARRNSVEIEMRPEKVLEAIQAATKDYPAGEQDDVVTD